MLFIDHVKNLKQRVSMTFYTPSTGNELLLTKIKVCLIYDHVELVEMCHVILVFCTSSIASTDNKSCCFIS